MTEQRPRPGFERFGDGWVLVDRAGTIITPTPMTTEHAKARATQLGLDFDPAPGGEFVLPLDDDVPTTMTARPQRPNPVVVPRSAGTDGLIFLEFVQELAPLPDIWQRMRAEHVPTPDGFCAARQCGRGGYGTPFVRWPCSTRSLADWACRAHHAQLLREEQE